MDVQLRFLDRSDAAGGTRVVLFATNALGGIDEMPVAWRVIDSRPGDTVDFTYSEACGVEANDEGGRRTPLADARPGEAFAMEPDGAGGYRLARRGAAGRADAIQVSNALDAALMGASIHKDGRLLATRQSVSPRQAALFAFEPALWIAPLPQAEAGRVIPPPLQPRRPARLALDGVAAADIVMTGGGTAPDAPPFAFTLENVRAALPGGAPA